jgi:hypothetical protein
MTIVRGLKGTSNRKNNGKSKNDKSWLGELVLPTHRDKAAMNGAPGLLWLRIGWRLPR